MKRRLQYIALIGFLVGASVLMLSYVFRNNLSDFNLGFCEGASISCICGMAICICVYFTKDKNQQNIDK